jgi:16S rRNA (guanine966-N2)-methyltransferase
VKPGAATPPGEVRLIGGHLKRSKLPVPEVPGLRPTPDRVRETLFNWLGQDLSGWRVLDAFAGSGALGFEAASRGAAQVVLLDTDAAVVRSLQASRQRLLVQERLQVQRADALAWMRAAAPASLELVLLDPPFDSPWAEPALVASERLLVPGGWAYLEGPASGRPGLCEWPGAFEAFRQGRVGAVQFHLLRRR